MATPLALGLPEEQDISSGELLALKWEDVDLKGSTIRMRRTLTRVRGKVSLGKPKTKKSCRSVSL